MDLSVLVFKKGNEKSFSPTSEYCDDFVKFGYYRSVFDSSDLFKQIDIHEIFGGTHENGITTIRYRSRHGGRFLLDIDGGFPVPELANMTLEIDCLTEEVFKDIVYAFEQYHKTKFLQFEMNRYGSIDNLSQNYVLIRLFCES